MSQIKAINKNSDNNNNKKYVEVAISDFKMNLIISNWLGRQKSRQKRNTMSQKGVQVKEGNVYACFSFI